MDVKQVFDCDGLDIAQGVNGPAHRINVVQNLFSGHVGWILAETSCRLRLKEAPTSDFETFDFRGRNGLGAQEETGNGFGVEERLGLNIQPSDGALSVSDVGQGVALQEEWPSFQIVREIDVVFAPAPRPPWKARLQVGGPDSALS